VAVAAAADLLGIGGDRVLGESDPVEQLILNARLTKTSEMLDVLMVRAAACVAYLQRVPTDELRALLPQPPYEGGP